MDLLLLVLGLAVAGFVMWRIPMDPFFRVLILVVSSAFVILFLLRRIDGILPDILPLR